MMSTLDTTSCASVPAGSLSALAELRAHPGVQIALSGGRAWVRWAEGDRRVLGVMLPVLGAELFVHRDGHWYRPGRRLPTGDVPTDLAYQPLSHTLAPAPVQGIASHALEVCATKLELVRDHLGRPATGLECSIEELARWADGVPTHRLAGLQAACCAGAASRSGQDKGRMFLRGSRLPPLASSERFWGQAVLVPLGYRTQPPLPESALRQLLGIGGDEVAVLRWQTVEAIPRAAFQGLTRSALRRACAESG
jgi:MoxR-vWA-beta-propeller ternary system domain bpX2